MQTSVVESTVKTLLSEELFADRVTVVWHAGEPLAVPIQFYEEAVSIIDTIIPRSIKVTHSFQTNGTLISEAWCRFLKGSNISVGISIDGPENVTDAQRVTRLGTGTFAKVMQGIKLLKQHSIPFHTISVVTGASLAHASEVIDFLFSLGATYIGLNVEELEGINTRRSAVDSGNVKQFFQLALAKYLQNPEASSIREFERAFHCISNGSPVSSSQVVPFKIFNVSWDGYFSTFSPELLTSEHPKYGSFHFGKVGIDSPRDIFKQPHFRRIYEDILEGVSKCRAECEFFNYCGGGAPSNKVFETGSFAVAATQYCRNSIQSPFEVVLEKLESITLDESRSSTDHDHVKPLMF
jgi:uncharacterized protein